MTPRDGNPELIAFLERRIAERGRIPFSEYMAHVLYHPAFGYYTRARNPIGGAGDFHTAADVDPAMGALLAELFGRMAAGIAGFTVVELGAGTGLLARHVLESRPFPYVIVERSAAMRRRQEENLRGFAVRWEADLPGSIAGCVFSNEFFDALPVRRFVRRNGRLREIFVGPDFGEIEDDPEVPLDLPLLREGAVADISMEALEWVRRIGRAIARGYHLGVDYGYLEAEFFSRPRGTLMCYRNHRADEDPYTAIGDKDITAHVNFSGLIAAGAEVGLVLAGYRTQREFLVDLGLLDLIASLAERSDAGAVRRIQALKTLLVPPLMGDRFKVLIQRKGVPETALPGFRERTGF